MTGSTTPNTGTENGCPAPGVGGLHSDGYYDYGETCKWCGAVPAQQAVWHPFKIVEYTSTLSGNPPAYQGRCTMCGVYTSRYWDREDVGTGHWADG